MRRQSAKAREVADLRGQQRFLLLAERGAYCEACPVLRPGREPNPWSDVHELTLRSRGGDPTDMTNQKCLCRECHHFITVNPAWARENGFERARTAEEHTAIFKPWLST